MKDIFIDTNIAKNFTNPLDKEYKALIAWLMCYDESKKEDNAVLVLSQKLLAEYGRSIQPTTYGNTHIHLIFAKMKQEGRTNEINNAQIKQFKKENFTPKLLKKLTSNKEDREHIPTVILSYRKLALTIDDNFKKDLASFGATVLKKPEKEHYK